MNEYDSIANEYESSNYKRPLFKYAVYDSFFRELKNIQSLNILDLACGDGFITRKIKNKGSNKVIGIDCSEQMISIAKEKERKEPLGIEYRVGKVGSLGKIGEFDLITGAFLLHYASSKDELSHMLQDIAINLKPGGRFIGINNNPNCPLSSDDKYGNKIIASQPLKEGAELHITWPGYDDKVKFTNYYWNVGTYEMAFKIAGFRSLAWVPVTVSMKGKEKYDYDFWKEYIEHPFFVILEAIK